MQHVNGLVCINAEYIYISSLALTTWHSKGKKNNTLLEFLPRMTVTVTNSFRRPRRWAQINFVFNLVWHPVFSCLKSRTPTTPRSNKKSKQANTVSDVNIQPRSPRKVCTCEQVYSSYRLLTVTPMSSCPQVEELNQARVRQQSKTEKYNIGFCMFIRCPLLWLYLKSRWQSDSDHIRVERRKRLTITIPPRAHFVTSVVAPAVTRQEPSINAVEQDNIEDPPSSPDSLFSKKSSSETSPSESQLEINPVEDRSAVFCYMGYFRCGFTWSILLDSSHTGLPSRWLLLTCLT